MDIFLKILSFVLAGGIAYLLGSVNMAIIITRLIKKEDIRDYGSGNAGMTNVLRTVGKGAAIFCLIGDFAKGAIAVIVGNLIVNNITEYTHIGGYIAAACVVLGHMFPIYYGFKGGKGILATAGALLMLDWLALVILLLVFIAVVALTRTVSIGSIIAAGGYPVVVFILGVMQTTTSRPLWAETILAACIGGLVVFMHRNNIKRLIAGEESKLGKKKGEE